MLIAQISDLHIRAPGELSFGRVDAAQCLAGAVAALNAFDPRPDLVLATGDLTEAGAPEQYAVLAALLSALAMPVYLIPGNHDARQPLRAAFPGQAYLGSDGPIFYQVEHGPLLLLALDSIIPGEPGGALDAKQLAWLERRLAAAPQRPTILYMHHPPFATGIAYMDAMGLAEPDALAALVRRHPQIERILCGHLHRPITTRFAGTIASTAPSISHQLVLDLTPDPEPCFTLEPSALQLHLWQPGSGLVSHTHLLGSFPGPYPFAGAG